MMKLIVTLDIVICTCLACLFAEAQENLVPNPSFEDTLICPTLPGQTKNASGWSININSADFFHECNMDTLQVGVPQNPWGYQNASDGKAYFGFYAYSETNPGGVEVFGRELSSALTIGTKYFVSFKASLGEGAGINCGINNLGMLFTNVNYGDTSIFPNPLINNKAHVYITEILSDTSEWLTISGSIVADSAYRYLLIGNFFQNENTSIECIDSNTKWSYYFIDEVCVSADSTICEIIDYIDRPPIDNQFKIFPNPTYASVFLKNNRHEIKSIRISDVAGNEKIPKYFYGSMHIKIELSDFIPGLYLVLIETADNVYRQKIILMNK